MCDKEEDKKEIEVVSGDDTELEISTVYDHINLDKIRENPEKKNIIIPEVKNNEEKKSDQFILKFLTTSLADVVFSTNFTSLRRKGGDVYG